MDGTLTWSIEEVDGSIGIVRVVSGADADAQARITDGSIIVGSSEHCELRITDRTVSRLHCELRQLPGRIELTDLGSKNGVWIAGCRVYRAELPPGSRVRVGSTTLEVGTEKGRRARMRWTGGDEFHGLVGESSASHRLFATISRAARSDWAVLLRGESGTGKELLARALHAESPRAHGPLVVVDGGSLAPDLADVELFGTLRGAYTGANVDREGAFEAANGGTLFLDEVGELPRQVQTKFLRVLEDGRFSRLGETQERHSDVRIVAATNQPLERMVNGGTFREELYYRLAQVEVRVPSLRERREDILPIARSMVEAADPDAQVLEALEKAIDERSDYEWPGNVRELRSFVRRLAHFGDPGLGAPVGLDLDDGPQVDLSMPFKEAKRKWTEAFERLYLGRLLDDADGNVSEVARRANMNRGWLIARLKTLGIER